MSEQKYDAALVAPGSLSLQATSVDHLLAQLGAIDIAVPLVSEGRKKCHRERYAMAYFLATVARESVICFPLDVKHQSQAESGPDFWLTLAGTRVGVECVEAASQESYRIERMREIKYPEAFVFGQRFHPSDRRYSDDEREQIASGQMTGPPWMTGSAQKSWMATMDYFVARKVAKLAKGNYAGATETWLLIQDQWPTPLRFYPERVRDAANKLTDLLLKRGYGFDAVYILSGKQLLCIERGACVALPIVDLWAVEEA